MMQLIKIFAAVSSAKFDYFIKDIESGTKIGFGNSLLTTLINRTPTMEPTPLMSLI